MPSKNSSFKAITDPLPALNASTEAFVQSRIDAEKAIASAGDDAAFNKYAVLRLHRMIKRVEDLITQSEQRTAQFLTLVKERKAARKKAGRGNA